MNSRKNERPRPLAEDAAIDSHLRDEALAQQHRIECNDQFVSRVMQKIEQHESAMQRSDQRRPSSAVKKPWSDRLIRWGFAATAIAAAITCLLIVPFESSRQQRTQQAAEQVLAEAGEPVTPQITAATLTSSDANSGLNLVNTGIARSLRSVDFAKGRLAGLMTHIQLAAGTASDVDERHVETHLKKQSPGRDQMLALSNEHFVADLANKILGN